MKAKGFSLVEILVVITIFAVVGVITTQSIFLTLRSSKKGEATLNVRENLDYAIAVIGRHLKNANSVDCVTSSAVKINYNDWMGNPAYFSCEMTNGYIASGSALLTTHLTSSNIKVTDCAFTCVPASGGQQSLVTVSLTGKDASATGVEGSSISVSTRVFLRAY
jgi:prepilin-type N-terminal cleavage/methylation domain-containing protein